MIIKTGVFKKAEDWKGGMAEFLNVGDTVCQDIVNHFINVLPPATMRSHLIQMGEPYFHIGNKALYSTIVKIDGEWIYAGNCFRGESATILLAHELKKLKTGQVTVFAENFSGTISQEFEGTYQTETGILTVTLPDNLEVVAFKQTVKQLEKVAHFNYDTKFTVTENTEMFAAELLSPSLLGRSSSGR